MNSRQLSLSVEKQCQAKNEIVKTQALDVLDEALSALSLAVQLQQHNQEKLERLCKEPMVETEKVDQVVTTLLVNTLLNSGTAAAKESKPGEIEHGAVTDGMSGTWCRRIQSNLHRFKNWMWSCVARGV